MNRAASARHSDGAAPGWPGQARPRRREIDGATGEWWKQQQTRLERTKCFWKLEFYANRLALVMKARAAGMLEISSSYGDGGGRTAAGFGLSFRFARIFAGPGWRLARAQKLDEQKKTSNCKFFSYKSLK